MKSRRQALIPEVIDGGAVTSQEVLLQTLRERGVDATQATISRDLKELGLVKRAGDGAYVRPGIDRGGPATGDETTRGRSGRGASCERDQSLEGVSGERLRKGAGRSATGAAAGVARTG